MQRIIDSPVGPLRLVSEAGFLTGLYFAREVAGPSSGGLDCILDAAERQLAEYFNGTRRTFDVPIRPNGTPFQMEVWRALRAIPYGEVATYGDIARAVGRPRACRAVGMANHNNPISIIVPCHRVIGSDGSLTGYGGGVENKRKLLELEQRYREHVEI